MGYAELVDFWKEEDWSSPFGEPRPDAPSGSRKFHAGQDVAAGRGNTPVIALEDCEIVTIGSTTALGTFCVVRLASDGLYLGLGHTKDFAPKGAYEAGEQLALESTGGDNHGDQWSGPHVHTVLSRALEAMYYPALEVMDPRPRIRNALLAPAGGGTSRTFEEDDMEMIRHKERGIDSLVGVGFMHASLNPTNTKLLTDKYGKSTTRDDTGMDLYMGFLGIPREVWKKIKPGQCWSVSRGFYDPRSAKA